MTDVYKKDAVSMKRGMKLGADRTELLIQDEMKLKTPSELYWFMHTKASIDIVEGGRAAILTQRDKRLYVQMVEVPAEAVFSVRDAEPLPTSPNPPEQSVNFGVRKLTVQLRDVMESNLAVRLVPLRDTDPLPGPAPAFTPLNAWSIPGGELPLLPARPTLDALTVDGKTVIGFTPKGTYYEVAVTFEASAVPVVGTASGHEMTITQATAVPGKARVVVKDRNHPFLQNSYIVVFKRLPLIGDPPGMVKYPVTGVSASAVPEAAQGNTPEKTIDGNLDTRWSAPRWSAPGKQWIRYDLGETKKVTAVSVAVFNGHIRRSYFDLEASLDGDSWTTLFSGESSGTTIQPETILVPLTEVRYVRLAGSGNSSNNYNSITEVAVFGPVPVTGVELDRSELLLTGRGQEQTLTAKVLPETAGLRNIRWTSANLEIAAVNESGKVTAVGEGRTTVIATTEEGGFTASAAVTVDLNAPKLSFSGPALVPQASTVTMAVYTEDAVTGVKSVWVTLDGVTREASFIIQPLDLSAGEHVIRAVAADAAGHEAMQEFRFTVDVTPDTLADVIQAGAQRGWIAKEGTLKSLLKKAEHVAKEKDDPKKLDKALESFEKDLMKEQEGKDIDPALVRIILEDVAYILARGR